MNTLPDVSIDRISAALADRYIVLRELGRGGMATVYLARDRRHARSVALKVLSPQLGSEAPERFLSEIRTVANLIHPHILPLHDSGEADGLLYYVMPYVDGVTLEERIADGGPMEVEDASRIVREIGDGLAHAHRRGLVHRDVKPSNIFVAEGHAFLADFGIAKALESDESTKLTRTGISLGTPLYMSPEQATGKDVDGRSDLYSLACVHYQMLTGKPPFVRPTAMAIVAAHCLDEIPTTRSSRADVPHTVEETITRGLAKEPQDRFATVDEYVEALAGEATAGRPLTSPRPRSLRPALIGILAAVGIGVAGMAVLSRRPSTPAAAGSDLVPSRVVVRPLENRTGDPSLDPVGRMGAEWITEGLHRTGVVDVVPSLTALQAVNFIAEAQAQADTFVDPVRALAVETRAGTVVSGAYSRDGDSLIYQLQVMDGVAGDLLQALDPVKGLPSSPGEAISQLRDRVMGALSVSLDERLVDLELSAPQPPSYASYQAFDEGMAAYVASDWRSALDPLYRAYELDRAFVLPLLYAGLSHANLRQMTAVDSLARILEDRRGELSTYHRQWLAYMIARAHGRNEEARLAIQEAARLAPGSKAVYNYAYASQLTHRPAEAVAALESLDPERGPMRGWFPYWQLLTDNLHRLGEHSRELEAARRARELFPLRGWVLQMEGEALAAQGDIAEVRRLSAEIPSARTVDIGSAQILVGIGEELHYHGYAAVARELFEEALAWLDEQPEEVREDRASLEVRATALRDLGRSAEALDVIERLRSREPDDLTLVGWAGILEAALGNDEAAKRIDARLEEAERADPYSRGSYSLIRARIAALLEERDRAVDLLRAAVEQGFRPLRHLDVNLEPLAGYPPLDRLMTPTGP